MENKTTLSPVDSLRSAYQAWKKASAEAERIPTDHNCGAVIDTWDKVIRLMGPAGVTSSDQLKELFDPKEQAKG